MTTALKRLTAADPIIFTPKVGEDPEPAVKAVLASRPKDNGFLAIDVETTGTKWTDRVRTVQLGSPTHAVVLDVENDPAAVEGVRYALEYIIAESVPCTAHNASFDVLFLDRLGVVDGVELLKRITDTYILAALLEPKLSSTSATPVGNTDDAASAEYLGFWFAEDWSTEDLLADGHAQGVVAPKKRSPRRTLSLKDLTEDWLPVSYSAPADRVRTTAWKSAGWIGSTGWAKTDLHDPIFQAYAGADVIDASRLCSALYPTVVALVGQEVIDREHRIQAVGGEMQRRGFRLDIDTIEVKTAEWAAEADAHAERLRELGVEKPNSAASIADAFLAKEGIEVPKTEKGNHQIKATWLMTKPESPIATALLSYRTTNKLVSTYGGNWVRMAGEERRLHPEVSTLSAATGRFTMSSPSLQNVPKLAREFILPEPGMALVSGDFSAVEVRIGAAYARESGLISDLRAGLDPYALIAESTWGPEFTPDDRDACKPILLGRMYGRSATSLARQQLSRNPHADFETLKKQAEEIMQNGIDARYPALRRASANLSTMVRVGMSRHRLPSGRCVTVEPAAAHKIFNAVVQGTGRELLIEAGFRLMDAELGTLWLSVHDEWVLMVPAAEAEATAARMKEVMATEFLGVPIVASTKVLGTKWGK